MIFHKYVEGDISLNKKSYSSTTITIFLAVIIISSFVFGLSSYYRSYRDIIGSSTGGYHFRIVSNISKNDAQNLRANRYIKKLGFFNRQLLDEGFGSKEKTLLIKMDKNALSTIENLIKEGELPAANEVLISNNMSRESNKKIGDFISIAGNKHKISGIYYDITYEFHELYNVFLNVPQETLLENETEFSPFIWYKNIFKTYSISEKIMENLETENITYNYNLLYLDRSFVFDPDDDLLADHTFQIIVLVLFFILLVLFYSIISNLFLVQESKSIEEYSRLKAIGATNRDIQKIIRLKSAYISQPPIILGIIFSTFIVKLLFFILNKVELYFSNSKNILENTIEFKIGSSWFFILTIYILSNIIIYLSTKKPIKKLNKNSILNGLKGNINSKSYKKYDLNYTANIEKDLSKQFFKNSRKSFISSGISLKLGFVLMCFILIVVTYYSMEEKFNSVDKYSSFNIQGRYATINPLDQNLLEEIESYGFNELINFRSEFVYIDYDQSFVDEEYISSGSLDNLEEDITSLENLRINIIGVEDKIFNDLLSKRNLNPEHFKGNKVLLLNTLGDNFNIPASKVLDRRFLKEDISTISVSEYGKVLETPGYEFDLDVQDKINSPLFDYPLYKNRLNCYMSKSEYIKLFSFFERLADLDQFEYIGLKSNNIEKDQEFLNSLSLNYFKSEDFDLASKVDMENLIKKRTIIADILAVFFSLFFIVIGFSNSYFAFYNLFLRRKDQLLLYKSIGMNKSLLGKILKREKNKILFNFLSSMPLLLILMAFIVSKSSKVFTTLDILVNINYLFIFAYIFIIYLAISKMYNSYSKEII